MMKRLGFLLISLLLGASSAGAVLISTPGLITQYVNPQSTDGGDGSVDTIDPSNPGRAFRSIKHMEAQNLNLVSMGARLHVILTSTQTEVDRTIPFDIRYDTPPVSVSGWTTSATNYVLLMTTKTYDMITTTITGHGYKHVPTNLPSHPWTFADGNWILQDFVSFSSGPNASGFPALVSLGAQDANTTNYFRRMHMGMTFDNGETEGRGFHSSNTNVKTIIAENSNFYALAYLGWNFNGTLALQDGTKGFPVAVKPEDANNSFYFYNCNFLNWYNTTNPSAGTVILKNCISYDSGSTAYTGCSVGSFNNLSDDTSTCGNGALTSQTVQFMNTSIMDYRLSPADTAARNQGVSLSTDSVYAVLWDINGGTKTAAVGIDLWSVGSDEPGTDRTTVVGGGGGGEPGPVGGTLEIRYLDYIIQSKLEDTLQRKPSDEKLDRKFSIFNY